MKAIKDGVPAFPSVSEGAAHMDPFFNEGMTLRDYFAAAIFPAIAAEYLRANGPCIGVDHPYNNIPVHVYRMADALLKERAK